MPRDGSNIYSQPFPDVVEDTTIESTVYNGFTNDVATDLNTPRPIVAGGTAAANVDDALTNLSAEKAGQVVTNYDSMIWKSGSFYSATTATGEPVDGHAFSGIVYLADSNNIVLEARDSTDGRLWIRRKTAGVWGAWVLDNDLSGITTALDGKVDVAGDTMTGMLVLPATVPTLPEHATNKAYVDTTTSGHVRYDIAQTLTSTQREQARANISTPGANIIINGDFRINQGGYVSAAVLAAGAYGHDQWKAGASGGDYSFTQLASSTQITIASGKSLIQPIEDVRIVGGSYVLTWTGAAQARAGVNTLTPSGAYAASPLLITGQTAGTVMSIEFNSGTLGTIKLESGAIATPFVMPDYASELAACMRYFQRYLTPLFGGYGVAGGAQFTTWIWPVPLRSGTPTVNFSSVIYANSSGLAVNGSYPTHVRFSITVTGTGNFYADIGIVNVTARL